MSKVQMSIIIILIIALAVSIISFITGMAVRGKEIERLGALNTKLLQQVNKAESGLALQNMQIESYKLDLAEKEAQYKTQIDNITNYYKDKLQINSTNKTCNEILNIINNNQLEFMRR